MEDFAVRQPPDLSVSGEEPITLQSFSGTFYRLTSDRCTVLISMSHRTLVELRSIEPCENKSDIIKLGEALDLVRLDQRLQSQRDDSETR